MTCRKCAELTDAVVFLLKVYEKERSPLGDTALRLRRKLRPSDNRGTWWVTHKCYNYGPFETLRVASDYAYISDFDNVKIWQEGEKDNDV